jgi:HAMP domain-containing protein
MDSEEIKRPRRNFKSLVIDPFKQMKFGLYVIGISIMFLAIFSYLFVDAFTDQYQHVMGIFNVVDPNLKWELVTNDVFKANAIRVGVFFTLYISVLFWVVFRLTHRYYGPLISIQRFVNQMKNGEYHQRCTIREKDELHTLVNSLNEMADAIEARSKVEAVKTKTSDDQQAS